MLDGTAEASWAPGLVERSGDYLFSMVEKIVLDGVPADFSLHAILDKAAAAASKKKKKQKKAQKKHNNNSNNNNYKKKNTSHARGYAPE